MGKAVIRAIGNEIRLAAGPLQQCAGQPAGAEAVVHGMSRIYSENGSDAVLLVDATNAFNLLNQRIVLLNIQALCPALAPFLVNIYQRNATLFVGGDALLLQEGTTQGDPLAMAMFAVAIRPLIDRISGTEAVQVWFADDAAGGGKLPSLRA